jgi:predicted secreted Zn-dependent protease
MTAYTATAHREGTWWVVHVPRIGVTQARTLDQAGPMAVDLVAAMLDVDPATVTVKVRTKLDPDVAAAIDAYNAAIADREEAARRHAEATRRAARKLRQAGISGRDTGALLGGLSKQRVSQLVND